LTDYSHGENTGETTAGVKLIFLEKIEKNLFLKKSICGEN
jgi:hypothetical protein